MTSKHPLEKIKPKSLIIMMVNSDTRWSLKISMQMGWSIFISNRCMMYPTFLPSKFYLIDIYFILFAPKVWVPNDQSFSLRQCTISYQGFFFHPIYSFIDEQLTDAGSGEGSADKSEAGSGDEQGSGDYEPVRDQSPICLDQRINVSLQRDGDQIHVSYRAFRFRTTKQGTWDKMTRHQSE